VKARVSLVSPALDPGSTTIEVWVETLDPKSGLKPGMTVNVEITSNTVKEAVTVPTEAVFKNDDGSSFVMLAGTDQKAHKEPVQLGAKNAERTQVVTGVKEGDSVITSGGYALPDGTAIKTEKADGKNDDATQKPAAAEDEKAPADNKDKE
jgi:HlyD family secretion protein